MELLSEKDLRVLDAAQRAGREISLERSMGEKRLIARTVPVGPVWGIPMVIELRVWEKGFFWIQSYKSVEQAVQFNKKARRITPPGGQQPDKPPRQA